MPRAVGEARWSVWLVVPSRGSEQLGSESDEEMKSGSEHRWTSAAGDTSAARLERLVVWRMTLMVRKRTEMEGEAADAQQEESGVEEFETGGQEVLQMRSGDRGRGGENMVWKREGG